MKHIGNVNCVTKITILEKITKNMFFFFFLPFFIQNKLTIVDENSKN